MLLAFSVIIFLAYTQALADPIGPASAKTAGPSSEARQEQLTREYLIKAAILYNVAKFASWPDSAFNSADEPVHLCVLGRNPFGAALETLRGKRVGSRKLAVSAIAEVEYAAACHVLFVSASEQQRVAEILAAVSSHPILTVADFDRFATEGGIVGLTEVDDRARLQVNVDAAGQAGVRLSSKLLRLADTVETQTAQMNA
ncbi:MAG: YfiR family protein, partial [Alphaproteobacteria bacterium]|nr:YfiR family protein [Alphaproteobacteria bacterium]